MDVVVAPRMWAESNFGDADLGDRRRTQRLVRSVAKIAEHPQKAFPAVFDWNELRGFYRLCDQLEATLAAVQEPHRRLTRAAMGQQPLTLIVHDTSELDYSSHHKLKGTAQIGNELGKGFLQHNSLAVVPEPRQVLGLAYQQLKARQPAPAGETTSQRKKRPRESQLWQEGIRGPGVPPPGCVWVDVGDRGSDDYEAMRASREVGHHFLFRMAQNRIVFTTPDHDQESYLFDFVRSLPGKGSDEVDIPGRGGSNGTRLARTATVQMASAPVWIPAPGGTPKRRSQPILAAWAIRIWEANPPAGIEPIEWILVCSLPSDTLEELKTRRDWYSCRWIVETYHDIGKNGCSEEARRFETAERMETCLAVLSIVAVRVLQLRCALDCHPNEPAEQVATKDELDLMKAILTSKDEPMTVRTFVRGVARLGGFLGRKSDGDPGVRALWQGYQRLQDMLHGVRLLAVGDSS